MWGLCALFCLGGTLLTLTPDFMNFANVQLRACDFLLFVASRAARDGFLWGETWEWSIILRYKELGGRGLGKQDRMLWISCCIYMLQKWHFLSECIFHCFLPFLTSMIPYQTIRNYKEWNTQFYSLKDSPIIFMTVTFKQLVWFLPALKISPVHYCCLGIVLMKKRNSSSVVSWW